MHNLSDLSEGEYALWPKKVRGALLDYIQTHLIQSFLQQTKWIADTKVIRQTFDQ